MGEEAHEETGAGRSPGHDVLGLAIGLCALALLALSPWLVDRSGPDPFYKGPLIFPMIVLAITAAAALPSALRTLRHFSFHVDGKGFPRAAARLFLLMCLFPPAIAAIGLQAATFLAVGAGMVLTGRRLPLSLAVAAAVALAVHLAFRTFLDIWFPAPWLFETLGF